MKRQEDKQAVLKQAQSVTRSDQTQPKPQPNMKLRILLTISTALLLSSVCQAATRISLTLELATLKTNLPAAGNTLTINGDTRTWVSSLATPVSEFLIGTNAMDCRLKMYEAIANYPFSGSLTLVLPSPDNTNLVLVAQTGSSLAGNITGSWATLDHRTLGFWDYFDEAPQNLYVERPDGRFSTTPQQASNFVTGLTGVIGGQRQAWMRVNWGRGTAIRFDIQSGYARLLNSITETSRTLSEAKLTYAVTSLSLGSSNWIRVCGYNFSPIFGGRGVDVYFYQANGRAFYQRLRPNTWYSLSEFLSSGDEPLPSWDSVTSMEVSLRGEIGYPPQLNAIEITN